MPGPHIIVGVDLAWGDRKPDGVCVIAYHDTKPAPRAVVREVRLSVGDAPLLELATQLLAGPTFWAIDAPIVCVNAEGSRPVDKLTHIHFGKFHAGCHPANLKLTARPPQSLRKLRARGYRADWKTAAGPRIVSEVYPHPAMVRWFRLERVLKYKRPPKANQLAEFARYQTLLQRLITREFPWLDLAAAADLLDAPWSKNIEDQLDGLFCALVGLWHVHHRGTRTQVLGDRKTGFILVPLV
ncbi:MAG: DUF429 domain-containing protein [Opitutales bacterium]